MKDFKDLSQFNFSKVSNNPGNDVVLLSSFGYLEEAPEQNVQTQTSKQ